MKQLDADGVDEFLENYFKKQDADLAFIKENKQTILETILAHMQKSNLSCLDSDTLLYQENSPVGEREFCLLVSFLLDVATEQDSLLEEEDCHFPANHACFSFNDKPFVVRRLIGQGTCYQLFLEPFDDLWSESKVISFNQIDSLNSFVFAVTVSGVSVSGEEKYYAVEELDEGYSTKIMLSNSDSLKEKLFYSRGDMDGFMHCILGLGTTDFCKEHGMKEVCVTFYKQQPANPAFTPVKLNSLCFYGH